MWCNGSIQKDVSRRGTYTATYFLYFYLEEKGLGSNPSIPKKHALIWPRGLVVRTPPFQGGNAGFESRRGHSRENEKFQIAKELFTLEKRFAAGHLRLYE